MKPIAIGGISSKRLIIDDSNESEAILFSSSDLFIQPAFNKNITISTSGTGAVNISSENTPLVITTGTSQLILSGSGGLDTAKLQSANTTDTSLSASYPVFTDSTNRFVSKKVELSDCSFGILSNPLSQNLDLGNYFITNTQSIYVRNIISVGNLGLQSDSDISLTASGDRCSISVPSGEFSVNTATGMFLFSNGTIYLNRSLLINPNSGIIENDANAPELRIRSKTNTNITVQSQGSGTLNLLTSNQPISLTSGSGGVSINSTASAALSVPNGNITTRNLVGTQSPFLSANQTQIYGVGLTIGSYVLLSSGWQIIQNMATSCSINTATGVITFSNTTTQRVRITFITDAYTSSTTDIFFNISLNGSQSLVQSRCLTQSAFSANVRKQLVLDTILNISSGNTIAILAGTLSNTTLTFENSLFLVSPLHV